ncbi:hypothetical protein A3742_08815 [Oleiphilus sp. HI0071]|jgi:CBS domain-containing protein|nr:MULTISPECIES: putative nucleotidyltransferase substrate binding domain-containing protein [unclassified Oleiphilus]KZY68929.1 hypothetical protein A3737_12650 [Oleiphilus sp. HI0065]KZY82624.1 hypothetical protein A3742_08815 [Oleiphilus sp. HI0071]KZY92619.1 hypothetical protein A3744_02670 [Oleiphilus sp. HI0073]KZZ44556.1 hypothetical protein A3758_14815 [Oleiphilus sp. HI0118]KZZ52886.1 hypothetical protein A3760_17545 [Oleiphilus sp. HI0122]KZZ75725.1 hypothetical protein A3767_03330 
MTVTTQDDQKLFVSQCPPFNHLSEEALDRALKQLKIGHEKAGVSLSMARYSGIVLIRSGSLELRDESNSLIDKMSATNCFLFTERAVNQVASAHCLEDCLLYFFPITILDDLGDERATIDDFFHATEHARLSRVLDSRERNYCLNQRVAELMVNDPIRVQADESIRAAAQRMSEAKISSLIVVADGELAGIVTDRDLRSRVLAAGVDPNKPISEVMTSSPKTIRRSQTVYEAQLLMMTENIHHLPVMSGSAPVGIITLNDFVRAQNSEPIYLIHAINRSKTVEQIEERCKALPELIDKMIRANVRAHEIGRIITSITDAVTKQLIFLARKECGELPCQYAWVVFGSQARADQMLGSDQDNGLILERELTQTESIQVESFARFVNDGLDKSGLKYCPGGIMAMNEKWCQPLSVWKNYFAHWIVEPDPKALMHASIFYDIRHVDGDGTLTQGLKEFVARDATKNSIFHARMAENTLQSTPPLGFFKQFVLEKDGNHRAVLDLKHRGTVPIVAMARLYCLAEGITAVNTVDRLKALEKQKIISSEQSRNLCDAHEFIAGLRLENQSRQIQQSEAVSNNLDPKTLSPLVRHQLKDAFAVVAESQRSLKMRFGHGTI